MHCRVPLAWGLLLLLTWGAIEAACLGALWALQQRGYRVPVEARFTLGDDTRRRIPRIVQGREQYYPHDPLLGWTAKPGGNTRLYRANAQGMRADREYAPFPPAGVLRIAAFGDSFVQGNEVANPDAWPALLEGLRPGLEVLNFGVGAYGVDQSLLRYLRDGARFRPHVVVIGFMTENLHRHVNRFRPFYSPRPYSPWAKPRFALQGQGLVLVPNPLPRRRDYASLLRDEEATLARLGSGDYYWERIWRPTQLGLLPSIRLASWLAAGWSDTRSLVDGRYNPRSEAFEVTARLLEAFSDAVLEQGSLPFIAIFPQRSDLEATWDGQPRPYQPLLDRLAARELAHLDLTDCFEQIPGPVSFMPSDHYAPATNQRVASCLELALDRAGCFDATALETAIRARRARSRDGEALPLDLGAQRAL
ncbi:MAG: SGNH/GDSL hydrolase family protein, partial [Myxococcales bacterium]